MRRFVNMIAVSALVAFSAWVYFAPYLTVKSMQDAAQRGDAEALSAHVDFPAVRNNLKRQMAARVSERFGAESTLERLGAGLANAIAGPAIDAMVSPESLTLLFAGRDLHGDMQQFAAPAPREENNTSKTGGIRIDDAQISMEYQGLSTFSVTIKTRYNIEPAHLVFSRHRLFWWKLTEVALPESFARSN